MTKVKICGLKRKEDIEFANILLPEYAGFVFAASPRQVSAELPKRAGSTVMQVSQKFESNSGAGFCLTSMPGRSPSSRV